MNVSDMRNLTDAKRFVNFMLAGSASGAVIRVRRLHPALRAPYLPNRDRGASRRDVAVLDTYKGIP